MTGWTCRRCANGDHDACEEEVRGLYCTCVEDHDPEQLQTLGRKRIDATMEKLRSDFTERFGFVPAFIDPFGNPIPKEDE